jgi:hypothetical protein
VATGVSPDHGQLPGFNTFKIDENQTPKSLKMTSLDITKVYGKETLPPLSEIPSFTLDFEKDYGFNDLTVESIKSHIDEFRSDLSPLLNFLSDKEGFDHRDQALLKEGLALIESWGLINSKHTDASHFLC